MCKNLCDQLWVKCSVEKCDPNKYRCDQVHKMNDHANTFVIVLELHLQKLFPVLNKSTHSVRSYVPFLIKSTYTQDLHHKFPLSHTTTLCTKIIVGISCYCAIPYKRSAVSQFNSKVQSVQTCTYKLRTFWSRKVQLPVTYFTEDLLCRILTLLLCLESKFRNNSVHMSLSQPNCLVFAWILS